MVGPHGPPPVWVRGRVAQQLNVVGELGYRGYWGRRFRGEDPLCYAVDDNTDLFAI